MALEPNTLLKDRYLILETLGQGGMGALYRATDQNLSVQVAIKENLFQTDEYIQQFRREATILATLRHPNLTRVSDHFVIPHQGQYLVMDFVEGEELRDRIDRFGKIPEDEVAVIGAAICDALTYLHTRRPPVMHRDIKPGNIKINAEGEIYLLDFGLAKASERGEATTTGARAMTPGYSSPEQYGTARTDARSDVYSLGATLYAAVTGLLPEDALARAMQQSELTPVRKANPKVSKKFAAAIEKAMAIRPEDRYQTADDFKKALLAARTSPRTATKEKTVKPPPKSVVRAVVEGRSDQTEPLPGERSKRSSAASGETKTHPVQRLAMWGSLLVLVLVVSVMAYVASSGTGSQILALLLSTPTPTTNAPPGDSATFAPTLEETGEGDTQTPTVTAFLNLRLTPTPTVTRTPQPTATETATLAETPRGGGAGQLAFASDRSGIPQIWLVNQDGSGLTQMSDFEEGACQPEWSPEGTQLAFISPCEANQTFYSDTRIYLMNADGTGIRPLPLPLGSFDPAWSPDGKSILYTTLLNANTSRISRLDLETNNSVLLVDNGKLNFQPAWSPEGNRFTFVSSLYGGYRLLLMANEPGVAPELFSRSGEMENTFPTWSPDGLMVLFSQKETGGGISRLVRLTLEMLNADTSNYSEFRVTSGTLKPELEPDISPDGLWVAYESWPDGLNHDIFIYALDGSGAARLTTSSANDFDPAWRPGAPPLS